MRMVGRIMIARARGAFSAPSSELRILARTASNRASTPATYPSRHARVIDRCADSKQQFALNMQSHLGRFQSSSISNGQRLCANAKPCATQQQQLRAVTPSQQQR